MSTELLQISIGQISIRLIEIRQIEIHQLKICIIAYFIATVNLPMHSAFINCMGRMAKHSVYVVQTKVRILIVIFKLDFQINESNFDPQIFQIYVSISPIVCHNE